MDDPQRVLILRTSALGDVVHCLPVLTALRRRFPKARLAWVVEEAMAPVLAGHPDLDDLFVVRLRPWRRRPLAPRTLEEVAAFVRALRSFRADVALDLMGNHKAGILARLCGAPRRIGAARADRREPSSAVWIDEPVALPATAVHAVDRALAVAAPLFPYPDLPSSLPDFGGARLFPHEPPAAAAALAAAGLEAGHPFALLHPGAGWRNKELPPAAWGAVVRRLHEATGLPTLVAAGPGEESLAAAVIAAAGGAARPLVGAGLPLLAAVQRRARIVLGGDTGPIHLAHALGTPVLAVHGPTDPAATGPYGAPVAAVFRALPCSFCHRRLGEAKACLLVLDPVEIADRALAVLAAAPLLHSSVPARTPT